MLICDCGSQYFVLVNVYEYIGKKDNLKQGRVSVNNIVVNGNVLSVKHTHICKNCNKPLKDVLQR